jgi:hypothetical protein
MLFYTANGKYSNTTHTPKLIEKLTDVNNDLDLDGDVVLAGNLYSNKLCINNVCLSFDQVKLLKDIYVPDSNVDVTQQLKESTVLTQPNIEKNLNKAAEALVDTTKLETKKAIEK